MGLLSKLKLPQPPGAASPEASPKAPGRSPAQTPAAKSTGKISDAVRKAAKKVQDVGKGVPPTPPKKGTVGKVADAVALAARVASADQQMNSALAAANSVGNPLNNRTAATPEAPARKLWQSGMVKFWQPGSAARTQALSLQGEARIAKAQEATALLAQARAVFQQGLQSLG